MCVGTYIVIYSFNNLPLERLLEYYINVEVVKDRQNVGNSSVEIVRLWPRSSYAGHHCHLSLCGFLRGAWDESSIRHSTSNWW